MTAAASVLSAACYVLTVQQQKKPSPIRRRVCTEWGKSKQGGKKEKASRWVGVWAKPLIHNIRPQIK